MIIRHPFFYFEIFLLFLTRGTWFCARTGNLCCGSKLPRSWERSAFPFWRPSPPPRSFSEPRSSLRTSPSSFHRNCGWWTFEKILLCFSYFFCSCGWLFMHTFIIKKSIFVQLCWLIFVYHLNFTGFPKKKYCKNKSKIQK